MQLQSKNHLRRRGTILTLQGLKKLNQAKAEVEIEQNCKRYTLEDLSEKTGLTPNTLSKVFNGSVGVDKRTLECCFNAFNLTLLKDDYLYLEPHQDNLGSIGSMYPPETCDSRTNLGQTHKMERSPDNQQSRPLTVPGGVIPLDSVFYIDRPILESLCYEAIQQPGALINIRAPKQMGKTSLMTRILAYSKNLGYKTVSVNLQLADGEILQNLERFLQWFCVRVSKQLDSMQSIYNNNGGTSNAIQIYCHCLQKSSDNQIL